MSLYTVAQSRAPLDVSREVRANLETGTDAERIEAMGQIVCMTLAGTSAPQVLVDVIRFVLPSKNKSLKKLLHRYWAAVPKLDENGKLRQEMILVVNALRNDLQHPNEYIRGGTLRFLTTVHEFELLEPLIPAVRECMVHRNAYVRKNAYLCVLAISTHESTKHLLPDGSELIQQSLSDESDGACLRNGFVALCKLERDAAYEVFREKHATSTDAFLRLEFIQFAAQDAISHPELLKTYEQYLLSFVQSDSMAMFEAASALVRITREPAVLAKAASAFLQVANKETDAPVKIAALQRVKAIAEKADDQLDQLVMDVLLVLTTPDLGVRKAALDLALQLVSARTITPVLNVLKKELEVSFKQTYDSADAYRSALISAIRSLALQFKDSANDVAVLLLDFLADLDPDSSLSVVSYVKDIVQSNDKRSPVVLALISQLSSIRGARAYLAALWVLGEFAADETEIDAAWLALREAVGSVPLSTERANEPTHVSTKPKVLADGTYATESPLEAAAAAEREAKRDDTHQLRKLLVNGDGFLACALAATLTKLVLRRLNLANNAQSNRFKGEALLLMTSVLRVGKNIDDDSFERIYSCINVLTSSSEEEQTAFLTAPHAAFAELYAHNAAITAGKTALSNEKNATRVEQPVGFRLFSSLDRAPASAPLPKPVRAPLSQLKQVTQLTGYSDPVYAEALMTVSQFDIGLQVMLFNQTQETLEDLAVEFYTTGELKVVETPKKANVAPYSFLVVRSTIRVSSADSATIFGNISYHTKQQEQLVVLHDIRLNIMDYIKPSECSDTKFREMWNDFEWENKVSMQSKTPMSLGEYLELFMRETHMVCLTEGAVSEGSKFLSANLYARSCFGEDALANLSIEQTKDNYVSGHVRIRTAQRGPAVSIGDRIFHI